MKTLTSGFDTHPVDAALIERGAVFLVLSLHAQGRDEEAREVALGLAELKAPPWGGELDLAPDAADFLSDLGAGMDAAPTGTVAVSVPHEECKVSVDGAEAAGLGPMELTAGVHWLRAQCDGQWGEPVRVEIPQGGGVEVVLGEEDPEPPPEPPPPAEEEPEEKPLLVDVQVRPKPWFGDGWNLALEGAGVVLLGVGAGLIGGSLKYEKQAFTRPGLGYSGLEQKAFDMEVAGWVLLGTGAVALTVGMIRMSRMGGEK
jgi:hypothetical protein